MEKGVEKLNNNDLATYPCAHCSGSGTCRNGKDGDSCSVCIKEVESKTNAQGLVCSVCGGLGVAEMRTDRINRRVTSMLAMLIAYFALTFVFVLALIENKYFSECLAFSGTLIGSITGYYFGGKTKKS